jgi:hypothetical protein
MLAPDRTARRPAPSDFSFRSERLALDFAATLMYRNGPDSPSELLDSPVRLAQWVRQAGVLSIVRSVTSADLDAAIKLREAIYRAATARIGGPLRQSIAPRDRTRPRWDDHAHGIDPRRAQRGRAGCHRTARGPRRPATPRVRSRRVHPYVHRPLPGTEPNLVRNGPVRQPRERRGLPQSPPRPLPQRVSAHLLAALGICTVAGAIMVRMFSGTAPSYSATPRGCTVDACSAPCPNGCSPGW